MKHYNPLCEDCSLHETANKICIRSRRLSNRKPLNKRGVDILFVGEAPGYYEDKQGISFVGNSGKQLEDILNIIGYPLRKGAITNIVRCRPPENRDPYIKEIRACRKYLEAEIEWLKPKKIICLGAKAWKELGDGSSITSARLRTVDSKYNIPVVGTFHPAASLYDPSKLEEIAEDLYSILMQENHSSTIEWRLNSHSRVHGTRYNLDATEFTLDIETDGLSIGKSLRMFGIQVGKRPVNIYKGDTSSWLEQKIQNPHVTILGHNVKFDLSRLAHLWKIPIRCMAEDTIVYDFMANEEKAGGRSLERLSRVYTSLRDFKTDTQIKWSKGEKVDDKELAERCAYDVAATTIIRSSLRNRLILDGEYSESLVSLYKRLIPWAAHLESVGVSINPKERKLLEKSTKRKISNLQRKLDSIFPGVNVNSPIDLPNILYDDFGFTPPKRGKKYRSASESVLKYLLEWLDKNEPDTKVYNLQHTFISNVLDLRKERKRLTGFINKIEPDCTMIYPEYFLVKSESNKGGDTGGTVTGRFSIKYPALHNFEKAPMRRMFNSRFPNGKISVIDGSQMEMRVAADVFGCQTLKDLFNAGMDTHQWIADICKTTRKAGKTIAFGILYGSSVHGLEVNVGLSHEVATRVHKTMIFEWSDLYEGIAEQKEKIIENKKAITWFGAIRRLPLASYTSKKGQESIKQGINFLIQNPANMMVQLLGWHFMMNQDEGFIPFMTHHDGLCIDSKRGVKTRITKLLKDWRQLCEDVLGYCPNVSFDFELSEGPNWYDQTELAKLRA